MRLGRYKEEIVQVNVSMGRAERWKPDLEEKEEEEEEKEEEEEERKGWQRKMQNCRNIKSANRKRTSGRKYG